MGRPSHQHAIGGRTHQRGRGGFLPAEMLRFGHTLMGLHFGELCKAAPVRFVAPDFEGGVVHRIVAVAYRGTILVPHAAVNHDPVADLDVVNLAAGRVDDARSVAATDMKVGVVVLGLFAGRDHVDWRAERRPYVVVVDPRGHHVNQDLVRLYLRYIYLLGSEGLGRMTEAVRANQLTVHAFGHVPHGGKFADFVDFLVAHIVRLPPWRAVGSALWEP